MALVGAPQSIRVGIVEAGVTGARRLTARDQCRTV